MELNLNTSDLKQLVKSSMNSIVLEKKEKRDDSPKADLIDSLVERYHPDSFKSVKSVLKEYNGETLKEVSVEELMEETGATCPVSTALAVADEFVERGM